MNREDIIRMAKEARFYIEDDEANTLSNKEDFKLTEHLKNDLTEHLERFAKLVAEHERETIAKMIEHAPKLVDFVQNENGGCLICGFTPKIAAKSVREKWGRHE
jgi:hypothetical protein